MKKRLPIGRDNFKDIRENNYYYVDKTKMIEELLIQRPGVALFPRPRRFGKTLMLSTLDEFFNIEKKEENANLFDGLYISKTDYAKFQGKYPVIRMNFKQIQSTNWEEMYIRIKSLLQEIYSNNINLEEVMNSVEKEEYQRILLKEANIAEMELAIKKLSTYLYRKYKEKVILLIDEYDVPIQCGFEHGFYKEIVSFTKNLFGNALKTNENVEMAIMTGILRVSRESVFSDLNNVKVYSIVEGAYNEYYGFTEEETKEILEENRLELTEEVKKKYDGYKFGGREIYNPWSILNYCNDKILDNFWVNTSSNSLIKEILNKTEGIEKALEELMQGKTLECEYNEKITFLDLEKDLSIDTALNFLVLTGYLSVEKVYMENNQKRIKVKIPNGEVASVYTEIVQNWIIDKTLIPTVDLIDLKKMLESQNIKEIEKILNKLLQKMSFYDTYENFYHGYMLGLFVQFLNTDYIIKSNREAGSGRFDISIVKKKRDLGIIIEFKVAKTEEELELKAQEAKEQIEKREYDEELRIEEVQNIIKYGIAFCNKKCKVI